MKSIITTTVKIPKIKDYDDDYIENYVANLGYDVVRWAITAISENEIICPRDSRDKEREQKSQMAYEVAKQAVNLRGRGKQTIENCLFVSVSGFKN